MSIEVKTANGPSLKFNMWSIKTKEPKTSQILKVEKTTFWMKYWNADRCVNCGSSLQFKQSSAVHTVGFDRFLSSLEGILNLEFWLLKLLIFYQKQLWNIRFRLISSTFWVFRPVFRYVWSEVKLLAQNIFRCRLINSKCGRLKPRSDILN